MPSAILQKYQIYSTKLLINKMNTKDQIDLSDFLTSLEELCLRHGKFFDSRTGENSHSKAIKFGCYSPGINGRWAFSIEFYLNGWKITFPCNGRNSVTDDMFIKSSITNVINTTNHTNIESNNYKKFLIWIDEGLKQDILPASSRRLPFFPSNNPKTIKA
jgi:hypothetical protein